MRIHKISQLPYCIAILAFLCFITGCTSESTSTVTLDNAGQILRIGSGTEPPDLDPHIITGQIEINTITSLFEGLVSRDPVTLAVIPAAADTWQISDDGLTYTFHIRPDAKWSNGEPLTAEDFYYSWQRILNPAIASENAYHYYSIVNAEEYNNGIIEDFGQVGIQVENSNLVFRLKDPEPLFLEWLTKNTSFPVHRKTIEAHGRISDRGSAWTRAGNLVSNGPFTLEEWVTNKIIRVTKNPYYWDRGRIKLDEMHFLPVESMTTEERMFRDGQLDMSMLGNIPTEKIEWYKQNQPDHISITPVYATYYYMLNTTMEPLDDVMVRRALAMSIDRQIIVDKVTKGGQIPAFTLNPVNPKGYSPISFLEYNVEQARQLLAEAGYPDGKGFPAVEILYNTLESHRQVAQVIQEMWKQNLNIETTLVNQEWKVFLDTQKQLAYHISRSGGGSEVADPSDFLDGYTSGSGMNNTGWKNAEFDALVKRGKTAADPLERYGLFQQAEKILIDEVPIIPIYYYTKIYLRSPRVKGWKDNLLDYVSYKDVYLDVE